jgi:hypothetical protein
MCLQIALTDIRQLTDIPSEQVRGSRSLATTVIPRA